MKIACVGDSITYGENLREEETYPYVLGQMLKEEYIVRNFGVQEAAVQSTAVLPYIKTKEYKNSIQFHGDVVILMLGSNDTNPLNDRGIDSFRTAYESLVMKYQESRVILCTISAAYSRNYGINPNRIHDINQVICETAQAMNLELADVYELSKKHPEWYTYDGIHPDAKGAYAAAELLASYFRKI